MICALVAASTTFDRPDWQAAAVNAFWAVADNLDSDGQLSHSWFGGAKAVPGFAADYAQMARAAIALYEAIGHAPYLDRAKAWVQKLETEFWFDPAGGFAMSAENLIGGAGRLLVSQSSSLMPLHSTAGFQSA